MRKCGECEKFVGMGDWDLCCKDSEGYRLCYEETEACEKFVEVTDGTNL